MHTFGETGTGVPAFLAKLWRLVEDPETNNMIYWSKDGRSFIIQNQAQFARDLLPLNYKHNNMASFIRQLNMYGFHKITSIDNGGLKFDRDDMEFTHPCFKRGCPYLLEHIKRKIANTKQHQQVVDEKAGIKTESVSKVLNDVKAMRGRQDSLDSRFSVMKQENEALWREIATLRQKHIKQQQIVNKLIQFLVTIVQPSRNMSGVKRTFQLMINDAPQSSKIRKNSETDESGPVIHELTEELLDEVVDTDDDDDDCDIMSGPPSPKFNIDSRKAKSTKFESFSPTSKIERPNSNLSQYYDQQSNQSNEDVGLFNSTSNDNNNDSHLVYHISEIPENNESAVSEPMQYIEENELTTPMVKREMARNGQTQQQQQKRQLQQPNTIKIQEQRSNRKRKYPSDGPTATVTGPSSKNINQLENNLLKIKTENDIDPLLFLDASSGSTNLSPAVDPALISPISNSSTSGGNITYKNQIGNENTSAAGSSIASNGKAIYEGDFIGNDIPTDLFEDSPMISDINLASGSYNPNIESNISIATPSTSSNKNNNRASTSTATNVNSSNDEKKNLTIAKYNGQNSSEEIMRLSSADEFDSHLDGVQDDLDNLKDLLRSEGYSLDANNLIGNGNPSNRIYLSSPLDNDLLAKLFNDSEILSPYGLAMSNENSQEKKGSELTTYQPYAYTDLSDILDINNQDSGPNSPIADSPQQPSSELNTPRPETSINKNIF